MGMVIGPLNQTPNERAATWFLLRELRADIKWMRQEDPIKYRGAIDKEKSYYNQQYREYVSA